MADPFIGEIKMGVWHFAPRNYAYCAGQPMSINNFTALFALIGTYYGGDGRTTFNLPDMRSRAPICWSLGSIPPGLLLNYPLGASVGYESMYLQVSTMAQHHHGSVTDVTLNLSQMSVNGSNLTGSVLGTDVQADEPGPDTERVLAEATSGNVYKDGGTPNISLKQGSVQIQGMAPVHGEIGAEAETTLGYTGEGDAHENRMPALAVSFVIALEGIFPSRN
ncbi:MAG: tail fiber protein [Bacteroidota bacterium]